jgi:ribosomal protein S18 acetylase RimI-like enzyme
MQINNIRPIVATDVPFLKAVIDATEMFPSEMLDDMIADYLDNPDSTDIWFSYQEDKNPVAVAYCAPERMTDGTYNLYLIAVHPSYQSGGRGAAMMQYIEQLLAEEGVRILLVETSGLEEFARTRAFYHQCNYTEEARIREFYAEGEDKVVFWKKLS